MITFNSPDALPALPALPAVPEPSSLALLLGGGAALVAWLSHRRPG